MQYFIVDFVIPSHPWRTPEILRIHDISIKGIRPRSMVVGRHSVANELRSFQFGARHVGEECLFSICVVVGVVPVRVRGPADSGQSDKVLVLFLHQGAFADIILSPESIH